MLFCVGYFKTVFFPTASSSVNPNGTFVNLIPDTSYVVSALARVGFFSGPTKSGLVKTSKSSEFSRRLLRCLFVSCFAVFFTICLYVVDLGNLQGCKCHRDLMLFFAQNCLRLL